MSRAQTVLDRYAEGTPYDDLATAFLSLDRWTGDDPVALLAEAAASTTGQEYFTGIKPTVERFIDTFVESERVNSFEDIASVSVNDDDLREAFGAQRKRTVLVEAARILDDRPEDDDLDALQSWAAEADCYRYETDPIGSISGVGPASFQYLRMLAGIDTAKPDPPVQSFVDTVGAELDSTTLDATDPLRAVASCEWLSLKTSYRLIEIDQLAWWLAADEDDRESAMESRGITES